MPSDPFHLVGKLLAGRYHVQAVVAEGGFGVVYRAVQRGLDRPVAIKVLKLSPRLSPERQQEVHTLFMREAQLIANLRHPAILQVVEFSHEPFPWMALEWLDGEPLDAMLARRVPTGGDAPASMAPDEALVLLHPALEAIAFAHAHGVAHRDIKPGNFMVIRDHRGRPTLKVLDFGIARIMEPDEIAGSGQTLTAATLKTYSPAYAAPEQVTHARTGPWTDVHALALVLTEILTGHAPYGDGDVIAMGAAAMSPARPTPALWRVHGGPWEDILARALALRPDQRFTDAGALLDALERTVTDATRAFHTPAGETTTTHETPADSVHTPKSRASRKVIASAILGCVALAVGGALIRSVVSPTVAHTTPPVTTVRAVIVAHEPAPSPGPPTQAPPVPVSVPVVSPPASPPEGPRRPVSHQRPTTVHAPATASSASHAPTTASAPTTTPGAPNAQTRHALE